MDLFRRGVKPGNRARWGSSHAEAREREGEGKRRREGWAAPDPGCVSAASSIPRPARFPPVFTKFENSTIFPIDFPVGRAESCGAVIENPTSQAGGNATPPHTPMFPGEAFPSSGPCGGDPRVLHDFPPAFEPYSKGENLSKVPPSGPSDSFKRNGSFTIPQGPNGETLYGICTLFLGVDDRGTLRVMDSEERIVAEVDLSYDSRTAGPQKGHQYHTGAGGAVLPSGEYHWDLVQTNIDYQPPSGNISICNYRVEVIPVECGGNEIPSACPCGEGACGDPSANDGGVPPSSSARSAFAPDSTPAGCAVMAESSPTSMFWSAGFGTLRGMGRVPAGRLELFTRTDPASLAEPGALACDHPLAIRKDGAWYCHGHDLTKNVMEKRRRLVGVLDRSEATCPEGVSSREAAANQVFGPAGYIRTTYRYTPFGSVTEAGDVIQPIQWSSEYYDGKLALVYYNYRHYNPRDGRWVNRDPIEEEEELNLYGFVKNNGVNEVDFLGELAIVNCKRYHWDNRFAQVCWMWEIFPCSDTCCKREADAVRMARTKETLVLAIHELSGCLMATGQVSISRTGPIITNMWDNAPRGANGRNGPVPTRIYRVLPKPAGGKLNSESGKRVDQKVDGGMTDFHRGTPSLTDLDESTPGRIVEGRTIRTGLRIHGPPSSAGCQTCSYGTSVEEDIGHIERVMKLHRQCGGMFWEIVDGGHPPLYWKDVFDFERPIPGAVTIQVHPNSFINTHL